MLYNLKIIVFINVCIVLWMLTALRLRKGTFVFHQLLWHGAEMPANYHFFTWLLPEGCQSCTYSNSARKRLNAVSSQEGIFAIKCSRGVDCAPTLTASPTSSPDAAKQRTKVVKNILQFPNICTCAPLRAVNEPNWNQNGIKTSWTFGIILDFLTVKLSCISLINKPQPVSLAVGVKRPRIPNDCCWNSTTFAKVFFIECFTHTRSQTCVSLKIGK